MKHKKKPIYIRRYKTPPWWLTKTRLRWFIAGILSSLVIVMLIGALSPIRMAGFVTLLSDRNPIIAKEAAITEETLLSREVFELINEVRQKYGVSTLAWYELFAHQAIAHSRVMAETKVLKHSTYGLGTCGENIIQLTGYAFAGPQDFVRVWMDSPGHKRNILSDYRRTGIGLVKDGSTWWGTQIFE